MSLIEKIALKPCPFCGGEPHPGTWVDPGDPIGCIPRENWPKNHVLCGCGAQGPQGKSTEAIAAWNNRAALTAIMGEGDGVQQCDREAAAAYWKVCGIGTEETQRIYLAGDADDAQITQAFARHRSTAAAAERARIVAWLRGGGPKPKYTMDLHDACDIADAIERGEV